MLTLVQQAIGPGKKADESKGSAKEKRTVGNRDEAVQPALTAFGSASTSSNSPITSPAGYQLQSTVASHQSIGHNVVH